MESRNHKGMEEILAKKLPWDQFNKWVYCLAVVTFDIELGQAIESICPSHVTLSEKEKTNICYLAFPDSNSGCMGDTNFHFRARICPQKKKHLGASKEYNNNCLPALQADPNYFHGYVYFRQVRDRTAKRGYFQKSLVLLTQYPFTNLFSQVISVVAPHFFETGYTCLEAVCHDIDQWPVPIPGTTAELPLLGILFQIHIPHKNEKLKMSPTESSSLSLNILSLGNYQAPIIIPALCEPNMFQSFLPIISHIQLLWELVLTCEPLIVMGPTPDICSEVVESLVCIIAPLKFASDYRPFFTIHDSEFDEYTKKSQALPPIILGVTNPFFAKTLQHWPHIIRMGDYNGHSKSKTKNSKVKKGGNLKTLDHNAGFYTKYQPYLQKDGSILKKLLKGIESSRPKEVQTALLKKYFLEITESFLIPLERYIGRCMPLASNISPFKATPLFPPFNPDDFIKSLEISGPQLTCGIKGDWPNLYRRFFRSPNFSFWYETRYKQVNQTLKALHVKAISEAPLLEWAGTKDEIEIIDLVLSIKEKMKTTVSDCLPVNDELLQKLETRLLSLISTLPKDLQDILSK